MSRVIGIGGVFFRSKDAAKLRSWYREHLGIEPQPDGAVHFPWTAPGSSQDTVTVWGPFDESRYGDRDFVLNYCVTDLESLMAKLQGKGIEILRKQDESYGSFAWIRDLEGNIVELWEPSVREPDA